MILIIGEKPSQAAAYAAVLGAGERKEGYFIGNGYTVAYCFGHLLELAAPDAYGDYAKWRYEDLPIVPREWKHVPSKGKTAQLKILKELMNSDGVEYIVNATDAGREGQLIFALVYEYAKCKKPVKRLWISSMEDAAIKEGFTRLKDGAEYDNLYAAASCREKADWLVGLNCTRLFSVIYGNMLSVGRVQSPTLAILVKRSAEIENFVKTPFYTAELDFGEFSAVSGRFGDKTDAVSVAANITDARITAVRRTEETVSPPKLHDLTTLQREANRNCGYTAQQTLECIQSLYEKKLATYPRTDSRYLTDDMTEAVTTLVAALAPGAPCNAAQVINSKKVTDHHAVIPTAEAVCFDVSVLPTGEREILEMLKTRLVCAVGEKHRCLETTVTLEANGTEFEAKGKTVIYDGWKACANAAPQEDAGDGEPPAPLPEVSEGQTFSVTANVKEGCTSPPKAYTEDTLLSAMENAGAEDMPDEAERKGLGTPATRAAIIEKLIKSGFVERSAGVSAKPDSRSGKKNLKNLLPIQKGKTLVAVLPDSLTSAKLTANWEQALLEVQNGTLDAGGFMANIAAFTKSVVLDNAVPNPEFLNLFPDAKNRTAAPLGVCPRCGSPVREGAKGYFCDSRTCGFKIWRESKFWTAKKKPVAAAKCDFYRAGNGHIIRRRRAAREAPQ
jgi:DNA topoisomerase-3